MAKARMVTAGLVALVAAYAMSQFFRVFLAVLSPSLFTDLGATPEQLSFASGLWFIAFAAMQIPVGVALDRIGPRRNTGWLLAVGAGGGAALIALAQTTGQVTVAMVLIGAGSSPVLMAAYYIFAKSWPPAMFGTLASAMVGFGGMGNLAGSVPLAAAVESFGWRETMWGLAAFTVLAAVGVLALLRDPPRDAVAGPGGSVLDVLAIRALWPIAALMFVAYAPAAAIRGLWAGPYLDQVHGLGAVGIGRATLVMGLAMVAGSFLYGPLDRLLGRRKWVIAGGNLICCLGCLALGLWPTAGVWLATAALAVIGLSGATFGLIVAHARAFVPGHLTGRGVTLINLFAIAGAGVAQFALGPLFAGVRAGAEGPAPAFAAVFLTLAGAMAVGLVIYLWAQDRND